MTNTEAAKSTLKDIHVRVMSASSRERQVVFDDLQCVLQRDDVPEAAIKGISRLLPLALQRYNDNKSRYLVERLITTLAARCPEASINHLSGAFQFVARSFQHAYPTPNLSRTCLTALRWLCTLVRGSSKHIKEFSKDDFSKVIESVTIFVGVIAFANRPAHLRKTHHQLGQLWIHVNGVLVRFLEAVSQMEPSCNSVVMSSFIVKHLTECKELEQVAKIKAGYLDSFVKVVISSKNKPLPYLVNHSAPLLKHVTHEEFRSLLLPAIQKALLRNPELILGAVGLIVTGLSLDLSQYALELGKNLATHMHSKDDNLREEAVLALKSLTLQCSDPDSLRTLFLHLLGVLNGSEGKLTVNAQRIGIVTGLGYISYNIVPAASVQPLATLAAQEFVKSLELEVHEGTLIHTLAMLSLWCAKFTTEIPKPLIEGFKKGVGLKASTSAVQNAYYNCMAAALHGNTLSQGDELVPILIKAVEKAAAQPTVVSAVTEGLSATALLLRLSATISNLDAKLGVMWNLVLDADRRPFTIEKFLASASEEALGTLVTVFEQLYLEFPMKLKSDMKSYHRAMVYILTRPSYAVRRNASIVLKRVLSATGGARLAVTLLEEFSAFLHNPKTKVIVFDADSVDAGDVTATPAGTPAVSGDNLVSVKSNATVECVMALCSGLGLDEAEREAIAVSSLSGIHHPGLMSSSPYLFLQVTKRLDVDAKELLGKNLNQIWSSVLEDQPLSPTYANLVKTMVRLCPKDTMALLSAYVEGQLTGPDMAAVTQTEFMTFLTPEGQLYDTSVIHSVREEVAHSRNIKRESKAYSYKDQMDEIELRKELEAKKKGKTAEKEPQLTPKQQELKKAQLIKESGIRSRILELHKKAAHAVAVTSAAINGNSEAVQDNFFCPLLEGVLAALNSPVSAPAASTLYIKMHECVFRGELKTLGYCIGNVTLRVLEPKCRLDDAWCQNSLDSSAMRTIRCIHSTTVRANTETYDETRETQQQSLSAPAFTYIFPLFGAVLRNNGSKLHGNESSIVQGLEVIVEHAQMRAIPGDPSEHLFDPALLPRKQMMALMINLLETTTAATQKLVRRVLLQVAEASSGKPGCASASFDEIQILLTALMSPDAVTRDASLTSLLSLTNILKSPKKVEDLPVERRVWIAKYDVVDENGELADKLWKQLYQQPRAQLCQEVLGDIIHPVEVIRQSAADALAGLVEHFPDKGPAALTKLLDTYRDKLALPPPVLDDFGRVISDAPVDYWEPRSGVAVALKTVARFLPHTVVSSLTTFFIFEGLSDRNDQVQREMLEAAQSVVDIQGKETVGVLLPLFQDLLDKAPDSSSYDVVRQSVVILMGSLARHLVGRDDERVLPIVDKLVEALSTPSQKVQEAVANCLPPLVPAIREQAPRLVEQLLRQLVVSEAYGARRGAAYGLAGLVKGLGILSLKQLNVMAQLTDNIQDKKNVRAREGALFAFEMLCNMLGRLFEPYVVHVLPHLLLCFGDSSQYVREATDDTAKAVMSKLSAHGVKLVLPALLAALEEESWRTKTGSVDLLGAMAFCAPKQLSSCLPSIVPKLIEVLSDSHVRVQKAGAQALKQIGSVIRNPEIQALVPTLMDALQDPTTKTSPCLQTLLDTKFVHFIDAPSLALIMPVVQRAFQDRSTETRKMAAQIIGNMYSLTDQKDLAPYLPNVIPGLKQSLLDPVPEVRGVAARALGAMVRGMGESSFDDLLPWLMQTLTSEASSVDRSGAAQGLSEVVGGLGVDKLYKLMPDIISTAERTDIAPHVKDGYIMMFIYMPVVFQKEFTPYIGQIINPILKALADESEFVRETALRAGQRIVNMYAESAIALLLPELERGLFDDNWRIRYSSVQLLGDLLYKISGVTGKMSTETASEDDNFGTEHSHKAILSSLGTDRRNRLLAGLYMGRSDIALMVRQAALHVWKVVVPNTPRTLREILPTLFSLLLGCLASTSYDKRQVAARTLGDLVRKLGERVLPDIIPILENGLESDRADQRQGVCIGLSEIMGSTSREMVMTFVDSLVPTVRKALCDPLPEVRRAAAKTFDSLHSTVGSRALDDILSPLLKQLGDPKVGANALDGLRQVTIIKSKVVLPYLIPQLTSCNPVNTEALSVLASVSGEALTKHLVKIMPALLVALSQACNTPNEQQELEYCQTVVLSVTDYQGVHTIMDELLEATRSKTVGVRRASTMLLCAYCQQSKANYSQYVPQLLRGLIHLFMDEDQRVLQLAWEALNAVTKDLESSDQAQHVADVRQAVRFTVSDLGSDRLLPGFCLPKGIAPILPIFREAIINGPPELKEQAANGLGEVIRLTNAEALKSSVVNITGPLIRILGDRYASNVRVAVLETLALLLAKVGAMLKPFLPQLQTTFLKALSDPNRQVRIRAGSALSHLIVIHTRADPLFTELHNSVRAVEDPAVKETMLQALRSVISPAGDKMSDAVRQSVLTSLQGMLGSNDDPIRMAAAGCLGALCRTLSESELTTLMDAVLEDDPTQAWTLQHGFCVTLMVALIESPEKILQRRWTDAVGQKLLTYIQGDRVPVTMAGLRCIGAFMRYQLLNGNQIPQPMIQILTKSINHNSNEVKQVVAQVSNFLALAAPNDLPDALLKPLLLSLVNGTKEKNSVVKSSCEFALVAILRLRSGDDTQQACLKLLDSGARESLVDVITKSLRKVASQPEPKEEPLDDTLLT